MRILLLLGTLVLANVAAAADVRLRSSVTCSSSIVRLADVAEIDTDDAVLAAALAEIPLCPAPAAGSEKTLSQHDVRQLLGLSGVERTDIQLTGSESVTLRTDTSRPQPSPSRALGMNGVRQAAFEKPTAMKPFATRPAAEIAPPAPKLELLIERGSSVNVLARAAGVRIAASGKALQPGAAGDTILIELADSKEKVQARVVAAQTVEIAVGGKNAPPK